VLFRAGGAPAGARWQLAVLDTYDGLRWTSGARFRPAGLGIPTATPAAAGTARTAAGVTVMVEALDGGYLPTVGRTVRLDGTARAVDVATGTLLGTPRPGLRYGFDTVVPAEPTDVAGLVAGPGDPNLHFVPPALDDALPTGTPATGHGAQLLAAALRAGHRNERGRTGGTSVASLIAFLRPGAPGTPMQFAAALALGMRKAGVPSRLVAGFAPPAGRPGEVRGGDATVWVELSLGAVGWVPFLVAPAETDPQPAPPPPPPPPPSADPPPPEPSEPPPGGWTAGPATATAVLWAVAVAASAAVAYLAAVLVLPLMRRRRRRRQRLASDRVASAWHEVLEALPAAACPAYVIPATLEQHVKYADLLAFTRIVDGALFSAGEPPTGAADAAWAHGTRIRRAIRRQLPRRQRIRAALARRNLRVSLRYCRNHHRHEGELPCEHGRCSPHS
jgi:hypothetical protein